MTASIWTPGTGQDVGIIDGDNTYKSEYIIAVEGQTNFKLTKFSYAVGAESIVVYINGVEQSLIKDYLESTGSSITINEAANDGDVIKIRGLLGSESSQSAATSAANAELAAIVAQAAAQTVIDKANTFIASSVTNNSISTGIKSFVVGLGKQFQVGQFIMTSVATNPGAYMVGQISSYVGDTVTFSVVKFEGAGTYNNWNVSLTGVPQPVPAAPDIFNDSNLLEETHAIIMSFM